MDCGRMDFQLTYRIILIRRNASVPFHCRNSKSAAMKMKPGMNSGINSGSVVSMKSIPDRRLITTEGAEGGGGGEGEGVNPVTAHPQSQSIPELEINGGINLQDNPIPNSAIFRHPVPTNSAESIQFRTADGGWMLQIIRWNGSIPFH